MSEWLDRHSRAAFAVFSVLFFGSTAIRAHVKPFWHDEILTLIGARLPTLHGVVFDARVVDYSPPLYALLARASEAIAGAGPIVSRIPSIISVWVACLVVFVMVLRRSNAAWALGGASLLCFTAAYRFSIEARPYGLTIGLAAVAFYAWSEAAAGRPRRWSLALLGAALALGVWAHYWAVLVFIPIALGEAVRLVQRRKLDVGVLAAAAFAIVALLPLVPIADATRRRAAAAAFWSRTLDSNVGETYRFLLNDLTSSWMLWLGAAILAIGVAYTAFRTPSMRSRPRPFTAPELAAALGFLALPLVGVRLGRLVTSPMVPRYLLMSTALIAVVIPITAWWATSARRWVSLVAGAVIFGAFAQSAIDMVLPGRSTFQDPVRARPVLMRQLEGPEPVVVTGGLVFLQLWYYAPPPLRDRLTYVADPPAAARAIGTDTIDTVLLELRKMAPMSVAPFRDFTATRNSFVVYALGSGPFLDELRSGGATIAEIGSEAGARLYHVRLER